MLERNNNKLIKIILFLYSIFLILSIYFFHSKFLSVHTTYDKIIFNNYIIVFLSFIILVHFYCSLRSIELSIFFYFCLLAVFNPKIFILFSKNNILGPGIYLSFLLFPILLILTFSKNSKYLLKKFISYNIVKIIVFFIIWNLFSIFYITHNISKGVKEITAIIFMFLMIWIGFYLRYHIKNEVLFKLFYIFGNIVSMYAIIHFILMFLGYQPLFRDITLRSFGAFRNSNSLAAIIILTIPFAINLFYRTRSLLSLSSCILQTVTLFSTGSRSAILAYLAIIFIFIFNHFKFKYKNYLLIFSFFISIFIIIAITLSDLKFRMIGILSRLLIIKKAFISYCDSNIFCGIGAGKFRVNALPYDSHFVEYVPNVFLHWWFVYGLPGLFLITLFFKEIIFSISNNIKKSGFIGSISLSLLGILVISLFENIFSALFVNWIIGIMIGMIMFKPKIKNIIVTKY